MFIQILAELVHTLGLKIAGVRGDQSCAPLGDHVTAGQVVRYFLKQLCKEKDFPVYRQVVPQLID